MSGLWAAILVTAGPDELRVPGPNHINGQGTWQNFKQGVELLQTARSLGSRTAKISLTYSDFTVLFEMQEFKSVQQKLKGLG